MECMDNKIKALSQSMENLKRHLIEGHGLCNSHGFNDPAFKIQCMRGRRLISVNNEKAATNYSIRCGS